MTIEIQQTCDGCGRTRDLSTDSFGSRFAINSDHEERANSGGWREVDSGKHLCPNCIRKALTTQ